ncbi:MAG: hypothetical protein KBT20_03880 [Bacteroidales bacterium]|nr:hypothetical protein [Candidatus Liminaster caballi]
MPKTEKEYTVEEKLANLYKLQLLVSEIDRIKNLRGELPQEVADMEAAIEGLNNRLTNDQNAIAEAEAKINVLQGKIEEATAQIKKYTKQQDDVQNNRQYEFLSKEIEYQQLDIELSNKRIHENLETIEGLKRRLDATSAEIDERQADLDIKRGELDEIIAETRSEEETLREKAKKIENTIETRLLTTFKRIHKKTHNGLAIVAIERESCGGCFNRITPQRQIDVKMRKKIMVCEYCGRILIDEELANENEMRRRRKGILANV